MSVARVDLTNIPLPSRTPSDSSFSPSRGGQLPAEKDPLEVFHAVFGKNTLGKGQKLPGLLPCFVTSYFTKEEKETIAKYLISKKITPQKIDLFCEKAKALKTYFGQEAFEE